MAGELAGTCVGGWTIGKLLGNGGSALVLCATRDGQDAAIKIIDPELEEKFGREKQEARVGYELKLVGRQHPHLVQIFDGGRCHETGHLFLVMEYLPYQNLDQLQGKVPSEKIPQIVDQLAQAARFLEELKICHRDIKPENVAVTPDFERVILLDLGILRPLVDPSQGAGTGDNFIGTVRYSPPEFVWTKEEKTIIGHRAITFYQIGALLHDLIMGKRLFHEVTGPMALLIDNVTNSIPVIESSDIDQNLINLARDCLHKDWRVRSNLVSWSSFDFTVPPPSDARARVRAMFAVDRSSARSDVSKQPISRAHMGQLGLSLREQLRAVCIKCEEFPRAVCDFSTSKKGVVVWAEFEASQRIELHAGARITLSAHAIDEATCIVEMTGSWKAPTEGAQWSRIATLRSRVEDISDILEQGIFELIANAMAHPNPTDGSPIKVF